MPSVVFDYAYNWAHISSLLLYSAHPSINLKTTAWWEIGTWSSVLGVHIFRVWFMKVDWIGTLASLCACVLDRYGRSTKGISGDQKLVINFSWGLTLTLSALHTWYLGKAFNYTTHGWTLISAVIEKASGESFLKYMKGHVFGPLGMNSTRAGFHRPLVYHIARYYVLYVTMCLLLQSLYRIHGLISAAG